MSIFKLVSLLRMCGNQFQNEHQTCTNGVRNKIVAGFESHQHLTVISDYISKVVRQRLLFHSILQARIYINCFIWCRRNVFNDYLPFGYLKLFACNSLCERDESKKLWKGPSSKIKKQTDYFEAVRQISDSLSDEEKNQIDAQGQGLPRQDHFSIGPFRLSMWSPVEGRSMVIISHPLSRLVNSWHHKFHKLGIEHEQGLKLIRFVFWF